MAMNNQIWVTNHSGKLKGLQSISTCCSINPYCIKRMKDGDSICAHCYAETYMKMRKSLKEHLEDNTRLLSKRVLKSEEIPIINASIFRLESFGDLVNEGHLFNYLAICKKNPRTTFALWTKNTWILKHVFETYKEPKPDNLIIVVSSPKMNEPLEIDRSKMWYVDHIFTVYDKKYIKNNNISINCGGRSCIGCQLCYNKDTEFYINEQLK